MWGRVWISFSVFMVRITPSALEEKHKHHHPFPFKRTIWTLSAGGSDVGVWTLQSVHHPAAVWVTHPLFILVKSTAASLYDMAFSFR